MADKQIVELPMLQALTDETLIPVYQPGALSPAQKMNGKQFSAFAKAAVEEFSSLASESAAAAANSSNSASASASAAQSAYKGVQTALNNLPEGDTLIINDLTTGGVKAALSAEQGKVLSQRPNPSFLVNGFFSDPVNQRGKTEYSSAGYTIDRWRLAGDELAMSLSDGITISHTKGKWTRIIQPIEGSEQLAGRRVTLSVMASGSATFYILFFLNGASTGIGASGLQASEREIPFNTTVLLPEDLISLEVAFGVYSGSDTGILNLRAAKLELGAIQTLANQDANGNWVLSDPPPDKGLELLKCQRYYQLFSSADKIPSNLIDYRPTMRANPAIGTIDIGGTTYYYADANL